MHRSFQQRMLEYYLQEIRQYPLLTVAEEIALAERIRQGERAALDLLVRANLRFVVSVARRYQNQGLTLSDLINEGNFGLIKAAQRFDETRGFKFISYAVWWIRQAILQALTEQSRVVRLPLNRVGAISRVSKASARLMQDLGRAPTTEEIAEAVGADIETVRDAMVHTARSVSMDEPFDEEDAGTMLDVLTEDDDEAPDQAMVDDSIRIDVQDALKCLTPREAGILCMYFGIDRENPLNLEEIGAAHRLTRERVRQIKERALRKLRRHNSWDKLVRHIR